MSVVTVGKPSGWTRWRAKSAGSDWGALYPAVSFCVDLLFAFIAVLFLALGASTTLAVSFVSSALLLGSGLSSHRLTLRVTDDIPAVAVRMCVAALAIQVLPVGSSVAPVGAVLLAGGGVLTGRMCLYSCMRGLRRRGIGLRATLLMGAGHMAVAVAETIREHPSSGLEPVGFVDDLVNAEVLPLPLMGRLDELPTLLERQGIRRVIIAFGAAREVQVVNVVRACRHLPVEFYFLPRFFELGTEADGRVSNDLWGFPLIRLRRALHASHAAAVKRAFDVVLAMIGLVLAAPIMVFCAAAVKLSSPGDVLFRQKRVGLNGQVNEILKFRSMRMNDDQETTWTVDGDDRVTWIGRIMRPTHIDELPQLWNVLRGDMSIVGPRPERPFFVDQFMAEIPGYGDRHRVKTGITGTAQVNGLWGDTSIAARVRHDNRYIEQWSLWQDLVILLRTVPTFLGRRGE